MNAAANNAQNWMKLRFMPPRILDGNKWNMTSYRAVVCKYNCQSPKCSRVQYRVNHEYSFVPMRVTFSSWNSTSIEMCMNSRIYCRHQFQDKLVSTKHIFYLGSFHRFEQTEKNTLLCQFIECLWHNMLSNTQFYQPISTLFADRCKMGQFERFLPIFMPIWPIHQRRMESITYLSLHTIKSLCKHLHHRRSNAENFKYRDFFNNAELEY